MRKFLVAASLAVVVLLSGVASESAHADHGHYSSGYGAGYGGYRAPSCHSGPSHYSGYAPRYSNYGSVNHYQSAIVPVYRGGVYQSYSFGGSPFGAPGFGPAGFPYGAGYGPGYYGGGFSNPVPRVQLRIGF